MNPSDAAGKANLLIEKRPGVNSDGSGLTATYTGTQVTIDTADANIVWNRALSRREVSFSETGFRGFFVKTSSNSISVDTRMFASEAYTLMIRGTETNEQVRFIQM